MDILGRQSSQEGIGGGAGVSLAQRLPVCPTLSPSTALHLAPLSLPPFSGSFLSGFSSLVVRLCSDFLHLSSQSLPTEASISLLLPLLSIFPALSVLLALSPLSHLLSLLSSQFLTSSPWLSLLDVLLFLSSPSSPLL